MNLLNIFIKINLIKNAKLIILPSLWESFGYTVLEAMVFGKVVIGTQGIGHEEIIKDGKNGFLVPPKNPLKLSRKIVQCLNEDLSTIEKNAYKRAEDFDIRKITKQMERYYLEIISNCAL